MTTINFPTSPTHNQSYTIGGKTWLYSTSSTCWNAYGIVSIPNIEIPFIIDGGGSVITTGVKGYIRIPFNCVINKVTTLADTTGSIVVDIYKDTYGNYEPTAADSICASAKPTLSSAKKAQDSTLTGWTTTMTAGDILGFNVDSVSGLSVVTVSLEVTRT